MRALLIPVALILSVPLSAQTAGAGRPGPRPLLPAAEEIGLARSAAPASISRAARVWLLTDRGWVVGDSGEIAGGLLDGRFRLPARMAAVYMMSAKATPGS